jgi:hypothetical protein
VQVEDLLQLHKREEMGIVAEEAEAAGGREMGLALEQVVQAATVMFVFGRIK